MSRLYRSAIPIRMLLLMLFVGMLALLVAISSTPTGQAWLQVFASRWDDLWTFIVGIFS